MLDEVLKSLDKAVVNDIRVYDLRGKSPFFDYSIVCSASNSRQAWACGNYLKDDAVDNNWDFRSISGTKESTWVLVDLGDIIVHIFVGNERLYYNLDSIYENC